MAGNTLSSKSAMLERSFYRVEDLPPIEEIRNRGDMILRRGIAYRYVTDMTKLLLPFRGIIGTVKWNQYDSPVGIYLRKYYVHDEEGDKITQYKMVITFPHDKKTREEYSINKETDLPSALLTGQYLPEQFKDIRVNEQNGDAFMPPVRANDDFMNKTIKIGVRMKGAPFDMYGKRLETAAIDRSKGIEGINNRNNTKRQFYNNRALSATKAVMCANIWDIDMAIVIKDRDGALNPMSDEGKMFVCYPNCEPFSIDMRNVINIDPYVREAIVESSEDYKNNTNVEEEE